MKSFRFTWIFMSRTENEKWIFKICTDQDSLLQRIGRRVKTSFNKSIESTMILIANEQISPSCKSFAFHINDPISKFVTFQSFLNPSQSPSLPPAKLTFVLEVSLPRGDNLKMAFPPRALKLLIESLIPSTFSWIFTTFKSPQHTQVIKLLSIMLTTRIDREPGEWEKGKTKSNRIIEYKLRNYNH